MKRVAGCKDVKTLKKKFLVGSEEEQRRGGSSRERSLLDLMGVPEFCDGWTPGIPEVISQFEEKIKRRRWQILRSILVFRPRRNVYHMVKQSTQRFTTGILTQ